MTAVGYKEDQGNVMYFTKLVTVSGSKTDVIRDINVK